MDSFLYCPFTSLPAPCSPQGAWVSSGRSRARVLAPSSHPCIPGHVPAGDALYRHRQFVRVQFKNLFAFKTSSAPLLPSLPVAVGQRVAGSRRPWGAGWVQDLPSAPAEPGLNRGDQIPDSPGIQPPCPAAPANRAGWGGSSGQMGMADKNT